MRYCTSCKKRKEWEGYQKTCPECRARVRKHMDNQRKGGMDRTAMRSNIAMQTFDMDEALAIVGHAKAGLRNDQLATLLKISPEVFDEWRERGRRSVQPGDPFFVLYYDVNKARMEVYSAKMEQWRDSPTFRAQLAWVEYSFPDAKPRLTSNRQQAPKAPEPPLPMEKVVLTDTEFIE